MIVRGIEKIVEFYERHAQSKGALEAWYAEVKRSEWKTTHDIKRKFASADFLSGNRVVFNIKGNHFRLVVKVVYVAGTVIIDRVGTHADYDKWRL